MQYSLSGLHLTEQFEGLYLTAYPDPASVLGRRLQQLGLWQVVLCGAPIPTNLSSLNGAPWTIGYGHTGPEVHQGLIWTKDQAEAALRDDIQKAVANVNEWCTRDDITQGEFDALVDFAFNCGVRNLDGSTLLKDVNAGDFAAAAAEFEKWAHAGGQVITGLLRRRLVEKDEFLSTEATS